MVHFWFGFFLATIVQSFLKLYIRMVFHWLLNYEGSQQHHIGQFSGILLVVPSLVLSFVITWFLSWYIFGNDDGFWIFWTYVILLSINAVRLNDYLTATPSRRRLQPMFHKFMIICIFCFFFSSIIYGIISSAKHPSLDATVPSAPNSTTPQATTTSSVTSEATTNPFTNITPSIDTTLITLSTTAFTSNTSLTTGEILKLNTKQLFLNNSNDFCRNYNCYNLHHYKFKCNW